MSTNPIDLTPFPNNIGHILVPQIDRQTYTNFDFTIPTKTIIRLYGTVGAGKGTLAKGLMSNFDLTNLETSYILRSCTWIYEQLSLEFDDSNTDLVYNQLQIKLDNKALTFFWKGNQLTNTELRSDIVDQKVPIYSGNPYFRSLYYDRINYILNNLVSTPVILDGRGSNTPYLNMAEKDGFKIFRFFLWVNRSVAYQRFLSRLGIIETEISKNQLQVNFQKNVIDRDMQDYNNIISNNLGTISADTGIIDTSYLAPEEVLHVATNFIKKNLDN